MSTAVGYSYEHNGASSHQPSSGILFIKNFCLNTHIEADNSRTPPLDGHDAPADVEAADSMLNTR